MHQALGAGAWYRKPAGRCVPLPRTPTAVYYLSPFLSLPVPGSQEDRSHVVQLNQLHRLVWLWRPLRHPPCLPQPPAPPVRSQVLLRLHSHRRRLGHPRPLSAHMAPHAHEGVATTEDPLPLPAGLHARRVHHRRYVPTREIHARSASSPFSRAQASHSSTPSGRSW